MNGIVNQEDSSTQTDLSRHWQLALSLLMLEKELGLCEQPEKLHKRIRFLSYEMKASHPASMGSLYRVEALRDFIANKFRLSPLPEAFCIEQASLSGLITNREASFEICSIFWVLMASALEVELTPLALHRGRYLKLVTDEGDALFIDILNEGHYLEDTEILKILEESQDCKVTMANFEKKLELPLLFSEVCQLHRHFLDSDDESDQLLLIYKLLVQLEPNKSSYLAEKALLHIQMDEPRPAYNDLKRFFLLTNGQKNHPELLDLFMELKAEIEYENNLMSEEH